MTRPDMRCLELLRVCMPEGVRWTTPGGGPTLWLELPKAVALNRLGARLHDRGVSIESTTTAFEGEPHLHGFRVSYAFLPPETLERAVEIVGTASAESSLTNCRAAALKRLRSATGYLDSG